MSNALLDLKGRKRERWIFFFNKGEPETATI